MNTTTKQRRSKLNGKQKQSIIFLFGIIGNLKNQDFWNSFLINNKMQKEIDKLVEQAEKTTSMLNLEHADFEQLIKDINNKKWTIECVSHEDKQKRLKEPVTMSRETYYDLLEQTIMTCNNCSRNVKACGLRKLLKKMNVDVMDPDKEHRCEYWYSK